MSLYSKYIFPLFMDVALKKKELTTHRKDLLKNVRGHILEIGFGTGLNLRAYPSTLDELTLVEPNQGMGLISKKRIKAFKKKVHVHALDGENLPFENSTFDGVVSTFTLCSISDTKKVLEQIHRVLKPGCSFYFLEHGLSHEEGIQRWQHRLDPIQQVIGAGCHLNRDMTQILKDSPLKLVKVKNYYYKKFPRILGYFYQGEAVA